MEFNVGNRTEYLEVCLFSIARSIFMDCTKLSIQDVGDLGFGRRTVEKVLKVYSTHILARLGESYLTIYNSK